MKSELILESLSKLDPENKDHWTQDGQPRLGAVGDGVTRQQVLEVAPLFSQSNPVLPAADPELTEEEIQDIIQAEQEEYKARVDAAKEEIKKASDEKTKADQRLLDAKSTLDKINQEEKDKDTRTDTEINMDYLKSELNQRMKRYQQRQGLAKLLEQADYGQNLLRDFTTSDADKAIAERVVRARRERNKRPVK